MAGSLSHIVGMDGKFRFETIENMSDAIEMARECFDVIGYLSNCDRARINEALECFNYPRLRVNMVLDD